MQSLKEVLCSSAVLPSIKNFNGALSSKASHKAVLALSKMPSRDELIAMLLQVWNAPIQNFTIGLNALKEKKEQSA